MVEDKESKQEIDIKNVVQEEIAEIKKEEISRVEMFEKVTKEDLKKEEKKEPEKNDNKKPKRPIFEIDKDIKITDEMRSQIYETFKVNEETKKRINEMFSRQHKRDTFKNIFAEIYRCSNISNGSFLELHKIKMASQILVNIGADQVNIGMNTIKFLQDRAKREEEFFGFMNYRTDLIDQELKMILNHLGLKFEYKVPEIPKEETKEPEKKEETQQNSQPQSPQT